MTPSQPIPSPADVSPGKLFDPGINSSRGRP